MDIPIHVAVRLSSSFPNEASCVHMIQGAPLLDANHITSSLVQVGAHSFPVTYALPVGCTQNQIYHETVYPLIALLLEGFDASFVTYGQSGTGKTYTLFGPGFDCVFGESEQGVVQRCIREIFAQLIPQSERRFAVNIGWVQLCGDEVHDLFNGSGNVECLSVSDAFAWMQIGLHNRSARMNGRLATHTLFTLTLEQQWISPDGMVQHRLSTASFCDLCGTERMYALNSVQQHLSVPKDLGLQALERIVTALTDATLMYTQNDIAYTQTTLTTLLKDSFGGRAQTLLILCVSPLEADMNETIHNLQFAFKAQCVRNFVVMNTFSDNNTPATEIEALCELSGGVGDMRTTPANTFGLQFAATQWLKLVSSAEGLLSKLAVNKTLAEKEREQIEEWLFLKAECEECLSSAELTIGADRQLGPIEEEEDNDDGDADGDGDETSDPDTCGPHNNTDIESDTDVQPVELCDRIDNLMDELRVKCDATVKERYQEFLRTHPRAVTESTESFHGTSAAEPMAIATITDVEDKKEHDHNSEPIEIRTGRRRSIQPGQSLSSVELAMLSRMAICDNRQAGGKAPLNSNGYELLQKKLRQSIGAIEACQSQIKELDDTINLKQKLINDLIKNNDTRTNAKQRFHKKKNKLEAEYEKTKKQLTKAVVNGRDLREIERLRVLTSHIEQRLQDLTSIKHIAGESGQKVKRLQQSLADSRKQLEVAQKTLKRERKARVAIEADIESKKTKENSKSKEVGANANVAAGANPDGLCDVSARISHLDHVLREKSQNLADFGTGEEKEALRHEIRNLRRTRDHLLDQRCQLDKKLKKEKGLTQTEERKLLECEEAIEAIDAAIEFKNELICGHRSIDTAERIDRERGEQMLMERLNSLSPEEMRTLLYKYFMKVIDLRESGRKLEVQLVELERERDAWEWRERVLTNAVRQARLEGERHAVLLQRQHETKLTLMLRHLAEETSASSSLALAPHGVADLELDVYNKPSSSSKHLMTSKSKHADLELCPRPVDGHLAKYKPLDKLKEKERDAKNKLFAKFQVLTRYHNDKRKIHTAEVSAIPQHNLRQLQPPAVPITKVTREKNKIVIQQQDFVVKPGSSSARSSQSSTTTAATPRREGIRFFFD